MRRVIIGWSALAVIMVGMLILIKPDVVTIAFAFVAWCGGVASYPLARWLNGRRGRAA